MKVQGWIAFALLVTAVGCGGDDSGSTGAGGSDTGGGGGTGSAGTSGVGPGGTGGMGTGGTGGIGKGGSGGIGAGGTGGIGAGGMGTGGSAGIGAGGTGGTGGAGGDGIYCPEATDIVMLVSCPVCAQDATCDAPTYTDNKDGTVSSSCCGLVWQQAESDMQYGGNNMGMNASKEYCDNLKLSGTGWRVPTLAELQSLVVLGQTPVSPTIDRVAFPNTSGDETWSSTMDRFTPKTARETEELYVEFAFGGTLGAVPDNKLTVRCVRGGTGN